MFTNNEISHKSKPTTKRRIIVSSCLLLCGAVEQQNNTTVCLIDAATKLVWCDYDYLNFVSFKMFIFIPVGFRSVGELC